MSHKSILEHEDFKKVCLATLMSGAPSMVWWGMYAQDPTAMKQWWHGLKKPKWADGDMTDPVYMALDIGTTLPLGCAAYLVYKHGGGFDYKDTSCALAAYGANIAAIFYSIYAVHKRNKKALFHSSVVGSLSAIAMAALYHKIHPPASYMVIPYAIWVTTGTYIIYEVYKNPLNP